MNFFPSFFLMILHKYPAFFSFNTSYTFPQRKAGLCAARDKKSSGNVSQNLLPGVWSERRPLRVGEEGDSPAFCMSE